MPPHGFLTSVGSILKAVAHRFGLETKLLEHHLRAHWPAIAGERIAAHSRPDQIRFKKLYLIVENSVWLHQMTFLKPALLEKINEAAGDRLVNELVVRVGEVEQVKSENEKGKSGEPFAPADRRPEMSPEVLAEASAHAAAVSDPDLRDRLTAVMAQSLTAGPARAGDPNRPTAQAPE